MPKILFFVFAILLFSCKNVSIKNIPDTIEYVDTDSSSNQSAINTIEDDIFIFNSFKDFVFYINNNPDELKYRIMTSDVYDASAKIIPSEYIAIQNNDLLNESISNEDWEVLLGNYNSITRFEIKFENFRAEVNESIEKNTVNDYLAYSIWKDISVIIGKDTIQSLHCISNSPNNDNLILHADFDIPKNLRKENITKIIWNPDNIGLSNFEFSKVTDNSIIYNIKLL